MIESVENGIQLLLTGICSATALVRALKDRSRAFALLGLFAGAYFLGDLYWLLFLLFYGHTPEYPYIPDISWYASHLFLALLLHHFREDQNKTADRRTWPVLLFTTGMCVFYMQWGQYASNVIYAVLMSAILWFSVEGLISCRRGLYEERLYLLYVSALLFCLWEYAAWTASCFFGGDSLANPYYWFDMLQSLNFLMFIPAVRKAVDR